MHCELVPGKLGISICMTKLEELPMDLGLVSPEREREMNLADYFHIIIDILLDANKEAWLARPPSSRRTCSSSDGFVRR